MPRGYKIAIAILAVAVVIGLISLRSLRSRVTHLSQQTETSDAQARRAVLTVSTPTDAPVPATIFWAAGADKLAPKQIHLLLSADPAQRGRQLLLALIANPPAPDQRTLPADTEVLGFYVLADGTAVADFSDTLTSETPSGILSEQNAVDSIIQTLAANIPTLKRLKILVHGQEVETLAGHVDLTSFFDVSAAFPASGPMSSGAPAPSNSAAPPATQ